MSHCGHAVCEGCCLTRLSWIKGMLHMQKNQHFAVIWLIRPGLRDTATSFARMCQVYHVISYRHLVLNSDEQPTLILLLCNRWPWNTQLRHTPWLHCSHSAGRISLKKAAKRMFPDSALALVSVPNSHLRARLYDRQFIRST